MKIDREHSALSFYILKSFLPYTPQVTPHVMPQDTPQDEKANRILEMCVIPRSRDELQTLVGVTDRKHFRNAILKPLLDSGKLKMTIPDKPNSRNQKYVRV